MLVSGNLTENSTLRMSNSFSELGAFNNVNSYRLVLAALAQYDFTFPELETVDHAAMLKFFNLAQADDPDALKVRLSIGEVFKAWDMKNPYRAKQKFVSMMGKNLLVCHINTEDELIPLFSSVGKKLIDGDNVDFWLNHKAMPYLINSHLDTNGFITAIPLKYFHSLKSVITFKIYERMLRFVDTGKLIFTPESLISFTGTSSREYKDLKRNILAKAQKEIMKMDHVKQFDVTEEKSAKKVKRINITYAMPKIKELKRQNIQRKNKAT